MAESGHLVVLSARNARRRRVGYRTFLPSDVRRVFAKLASESSAGSPD
jgi:hypothetical protein